MFTGASNKPKVNEKYKDLDTEFIWYLTSKGFRVPTNVTYLQGMVYVPDHNGQLKQTTKS